MKKNFLRRGQANFWAGLAVVLPAFVSIAVLVWLYRNVVNFADALLILLPRDWTHQNHGNGPLYWYSGIMALALAAALICALGVFARHYFGKRIIEWIEAAVLRVPVFSKLYGAVRQLNDAFSPGNKPSFRSVVMVEFPQPGTYSMGFLTTDPQGEVRTRTGENAVCVFIPLTPNVTAGFLIFVAEEKVTKLDMSVADALGYIISLGSITPGKPSTASAVAA